MFQFQVDEKNRDSRRNRREHMPRDKKKARRAQQWLVLQGDYGGQIYLTVPKSLVGANADARTLLAELDAKAWDCNEGEGASVYLHTATKNNGVSGGMGGGELTNELWLHDEFLADATTDWVARARELLDMQ